MADAPQPAQTRKVEKGSGDWVTESITNATTGETIRVTSFTRAQLDSMKANIADQYTKGNANVDAMLALLNPPA